MKFALLPAIAVALIGSALNGVVQPALRIPVYGVSMFVFGLSMWPLARQNHHPALSRFLVVDGNVAFSRYLMLWIGVTIVIISVFGPLLLSDSLSK